MDASDFPVFVRRCTHEIGRAYLYKKALEGMWSAETEHAVDFIRLCEWAMRDQMLLHLIKVLHPDDDCTLPKIRKYAAARVDKIIKSNNVDYDALVSLAGRIKDNIRNRTLAHIDPQSAHDPSKFWRQADIKWSEVDSAIDHTLSILQDLYKEEFGESLWLHDYDGKDAKKITTAASEHGWLHDS